MGASSRAGARGAFGASDDPQARVAYVSSVCVLGGAGVEA